mmetsp:Transcript_33627/g.77590  ORF Transcript_33627/g.77590 Transcript_33627/m.77590 type:complete len:233 (+) Transcript_33627:73-771(+)
MSGLGNMLWNGRTSWVKTTPNYSSFEAVRPNYPTRHGSNMSYGITPFLSIDMIGRSSAQMVQPSHTSSIIITMIRLPRQKMVVVSFHYTRSMFPVSWWMSDQEISSPNRLFGSHDASECRLRWPQRQPPSPISPCDPTVPSRPKSENPKMFGGPFNKMLSNHVTKNRPPQRIHKTRCQQYLTEKQRHWPHPCQRSSKIVNRYKNVCNNVRQTRNARKQVWICNCAWLKSGVR